nr:PREDICTED: uncharacterized protein LOC108219417 isoform X1 [Daucus carota subsp. sativus]
MGKISQQQLPLHQQEIDGVGSSDHSGICFSMWGASKLCKVCNLRCLVVLILSVSVFLSAIRWGLPHHSKKSGFDAKSEIKNSATVQAYFRLQRPVSVLIPFMSKLEYDINEEIGIPSTKVAILSMHPAHVVNSTDVIFGMLSDPISAPINAIYLSVLRSSFVGLFQKQVNLTVTNSTFGQPALFESVKFPGGITVIPKKSASPWQIPQIFFNFTLHNTIKDIEQNFDDFKVQLTSGLHLAPDENIYVQVTNEIGSTVDTPVTVQISVTSDQGGILPQRLKQLAQTITGSHSKNLGLDNSVFGKVKQIRLSSYLRNTLHASSPTPSPAPSPGGNEYTEPSYSPDISPSYAPAPLPHLRHKSPCYDCAAPSPSVGNNPISPSPYHQHYSPNPKSNSPEPSNVYTHAPHPSPHCGSENSPSPAPSQSKPVPPSPLSPALSNPLTPTLSPHSSTPATPMAPTSQTIPGLSPLPAVAYSSSPGKGRINGMSSDTSSSSSFSSKTWTFLIFMLLTLHQLCWV